MTVNLERNETQDAPDRRSKVPRELGNDNTEYRNMIAEHKSGCSAPDAVKTLQQEVKDLWKKVILIEVLDHRIKVVEDSLATIEKDIAATMISIHAIQTSLAESNIVHIWVGRVMVGVISAVSAFAVAKYS